MNMTVKQKQCLLAYLGYYVGNIDNVWGTLSKTATKAFQQDHGLKDDGVFEDATAKAVLAAVAKNETKKTEEPKTGDFWDEIEYFSRSEFRCTCNGRYCNGFPVEPDEKMVRTVNQIRKHFGRAFSPNSAIRCAKRNADPDVGGASDSQHLYGKAADISVPGVSPKDVAAYAETLLPNTGGIGIYSWGIHIDSRKTKSRWNG